MLSFFEPRMLFHLLKIWSFFGIFLQDLLDKVDSFIWEVIWVVQFEVLDLVESFSLEDTVEWRLANKEFVRKHTNCPDVNSVIIRAFLKHFRRQVVRSSANSLSIVAWTVTTPPKIWDLNCPVTVQQVFRLEVTVHYIFGMQVFQRLNDLPNIVSCFLLGKSFVLRELQLLKKFTARCKL